MPTRGEKSSGRMNGRIQGRNRGDHFFVLPAVILLVVMSSPMYRCRKRLWLSSLSCSSRTASMRLKMVTSDSCSASACLFISSLAFLLMRSISSLVLLGLIDRTSSGPKWHSTGPTSELSLGTTSGPLLFRLGRRGRRGMGCWMEDSSPLSTATEEFEDDEDDEEERSMG